MKKILVTGSSSGIGKQISLELLKQGYRVLGLSRRCGFSHERYEHVIIDFCELATVEEKLKGIVKTHNDIDACIFSCGIGLFGQLEQLSRKQISRLINVNFTSQVLVAKTFLPQMKRRALGDLIFIGSKSGLQGENQGSLYCASKFALRGFCQSLRHECSSANIRTCIIEPGMCRTPFFDNLHFKPGHDYHNAIDPSTIADTVCFILKLPSNTVIDEIILSPQKKVIAKSTPNKPTTPIQAIDF